MLRSKLIESQNLLPWLVQQAGQLRVSPLQDQNRCAHRAARLVFTVSDPDPQHFPVALLAGPHHDQHALGNDFPAACRGRVTPELGYQRVRRFVTRQGKEEDHVPDGAASDELRIDAANLAKKGC